MGKKNHQIWILLLVLLLFTGCGQSRLQAPLTVSDNPLSTSLPSQVISTQPQAAPSASPSVSKYTGTVWLDPILPDFAAGSLILPAGWKNADQATSDISILFTDQNQIAQWILALTAPFPTLTDEVTAAGLQAAWQGHPDSDFVDRDLLMSQPVYDALSSYWGETQNSSVQILDEPDLLQNAWDTGSFAVIPFDKLEPRWKVIAIDGISPIRTDFDPDQYALALPIGLQGEQKAVDQLLSDGHSAGTALMPVSNRDSSKLTVLAMTGVTALARSTAYTMKQEGITYPGENVRQVLASADITHISNEVSFAENCPEPQPQRTGMMFCSSPSYIELLEYIGTDIIELTGDHLGDWGQKAIYLTLQMYEDEGWPVYGGGITLQAGRQPVFMEHNGNRLAFIGCNAKGAAFATATDTSPGAVPCDFDSMRAQIEQLAADGYLPVVSIQHNEYDLYEAQEVQIRDFHRLADSGAVIVSGSQSHRPQGMEFYAGAFLHYGLGNLFFDQYSVGKPFRQGTIDRHIFYDNRYISTELIPTYLVDFAQPHILSGEERAELLEILYDASCW